MQPIDSLRFLTQAAQDLAITLPTSAREPFLQAAQFHVTQIEQALTPAVEPEHAEP